jgi:hypothetical protein
MVEAAAWRSCLIADGGRSEKERDAEGGESGEGSNTVLYLCTWCRAPGRSVRWATPNPVREAHALACVWQLTGSSNSYRYRFPKSVTCARILAEAASWLWYGVRTSKHFKSRLDS